MVSFGQTMGIDRFEIVSLFLITNFLELNLKIENNQNNSFFDEYRHYVRYNRKEQTVWVGSSDFLKFSFWLQ